MTNEPKNYADLIAKYLNKRIDNEIGFDHPELNERVAKVIETSTDALRKIADDEIMEKWYLKLLADSKHA